MTAATFDFKIEQGAKISKRFQYNDEDGTPVPLTGFSGRMQIRETQDDTTVLLELTTANGRIIFEAAAEVGRIDWDVGATLTETGTLDWQSGVYDFEIFEDADADNVIRLLEGKVTVDLEVTR
jgi:hypothetical protein